MFAFSLKWLSFALVHYNLIIKEYILIQEVTSHNDYFPFFRHSADGWIHLLPLSILSMSEWLMDALPCQTCCITTSAVLIKVTSVNYDRTVCLKYFSLFYSIDLYLFLYFHRTRLLIAAITQIEFFSLFFPQVLNDILKKISLEIPGEGEWCLMMLTF